MREIKILKKVSNHPNIITFVSGSFISKSESGQNYDEYLLCTELCKGIFKIAKFQVGSFSYNRGSQTAALYYMVDNEDLQQGCNCTLQII